MLSIVAYVIAGLFFLFVGLGQTVFNLSLERELGWGLFCVVLAWLLAGVGPAFNWSRAAA